MIADGAEMLKEEWSENTRRQKRTLLLVSTISIIIVATGWFPTKFSTLGITLDLSDRQAAFWILLVIQVYLLITFLAYVVPESMYRNLKIGYNLNKEKECYYPWQIAIVHVGLRMIVDFALPVLIATIAIFCLVWAGILPDNIGKYSKVFTWTCKIISTGLLIFAVFNFLAMTATFLPSVFAVLKAPKKFKEDEEKEKETQKKEQENKL